VGLGPPFPLQSLQAHPIKHTVVTLRLARSTDPSPVKDDTEGEGDPPLLGKQTLQIAGDPIGISFVTEAEAPSQTFDVGVHCDSRRDIECLSENDLGSLPANARQTDHSLEGSRELPVMVGHQSPGAVTKSPGFVSVETRRVDDLFYLGYISLSHRLRGRPAFEKLRRYQVDSDIGALRRKYRGCQKLPRRFKVQLAPCIRIKKVQTPADICCAPLSVHHSLKVLPPMNSRNSEVWGTSSGNTGTNIDSPLSRR